MKNSQIKNNVLVVFGKDFPIRQISKQKFDTVVADKMFQVNIESLGYKFVELNTLIDTENINEANTFLEDLSRLTLPDGSHISKSFMYKGYELWWIHYDSIYRYFCLPYTQYKRLLEYLKNFNSVVFYQPPYKSLFSHYLHAHKCKVSMFRESNFKSFPTVPLGILLQIFITLLCIPILMVYRRRTMIFIGDKFEKSKDYDFRMKFVYQELRQRYIPFVEFIRSLESWKIVFKHAIKRRRPVIYSEGVAFIGRFISIISGGRRSVKHKFGIHAFASQIDLEERFKFLVATHYLLGAYDDIWATRIMEWILRIIGVNVAFIAAATERNFHSVLGCKLNTISTVGILHGVASRASSPYDFMFNFNGEKMLSVDKYGLWSEWWKEYYIKNSKAYKPEQLYVSGPMRPLEILEESNTNTVPKGDITRVLFISEQTAVPSEVMPYLRKLIDQRDIKLTIKFRPYRDRFEGWLLHNEPQILKLQHVHIVKGAMQEAIQNTDAVVGFRSTGVLESLLQLKVPVFLRTQKWGDYYSMTESDEGRHFFAENPVELIEKIKNICTIPRKSIINLREQYFGDPYKNGSKWVVDEMEKVLKQKS